MRRVIGRTLTPVVDAALRALDGTPSVDEHRAMAAALSRASHGIGVVDEAAFAASERARTLANQVAVQTEAAPSLAAAWPYDAAPLPPAARVFWARLHSGACSTASAAGILSRLPSKLDAKRWFPKVGVPRGLADVFRSLIAAREAAGLDLYARDVSERLLRHVEIRQDDALVAPGALQETEAARELDKLAWAHALLDCAAAFEDLRFLNAALKWIDRRANAIGAGAQPGPSQAFAYVSAVERQETLLDRLAP